MICLHINARYNAKLCILRKKIFSNTSNHVATPSTKLNYQLHLRSFQKMFMLAKQEMNLDVLITPKRFKGGEPVTKNFFLIL